MYLIYSLTYLDFGDRLGIPVLIYSDQCTEVTKKANVQSKLAVSFLSTVCESIPKMIGEGT